MNTATLVAGPGCVPTPTTACFHCGEPLAAGAAWSARVDGATRALCCAGCQAVVETIVAHGLEAFYRQRAALAETPAAMTPALRRTLATLDDPAVLASFAEDTTPAGATVPQRTAVLALGGMTCAACAWLLERRLRAIPGVVDCGVNYATRHAELTWQPGQVGIGTLVAAAHDLGYDAAPLASDEGRAQRQAESRRELRRFGVAALCGMQVMMIAAGLYFEAADSGQFRAALQWLCAALSVPVVTWCAWPFTRGAWFALRAGAVTMDVPVTLGVWLAFAGSVVALLRGTGEVYFDSVTMFVGLLLLSRLLEQQARHRSLRYLEDLARIDPAPVERLGAGAPVLVPASALVVGDRIRVAAGATLPCDGVVLAGASSLDERLLTGEGTPRPRAAGDSVVAGSINIESPLEMRVSAVGAGTVIARIAQIALAAQARKPRVLAAAERAAGLFIHIVLALAAITATWHVWHGQSWLEPTLVVLVISCPCALALAVPTAVSVALAGLLRQGVLVIRPDALQSLATITRVVFDKTGTLTAGEPVLKGIDVGEASDVDATRALALAAALGTGSAHPVAQALVRAAAAPASGIGTPVQIPGHGVSADWGTRRLRLGSRGWLAQEGVTDLPPAGDWAGEETLLAADTTFLARFRLQDPPRPEAAAVIAHFRTAGIPPAILSGDHGGAVRALASVVGIDEVRASCDPASKLATLESLQQRGERVLTVGDGINDTPMLARAEVGVTLAGASAYAKLNADLVLLKPGLAGLVTAHEAARRLDRIARQNLRWAIAYNGVALPLALAGVVAPWVAALLMAGSSLVVIANAGRLYRSPG